MFATLGQDAILIDGPQALGDIDSSSVQGVIDFLLSNCRQSNQIRDIAPMKEWVTSPYYLGEECRSIYPFWKDVLVEFDEGNYNELILSGSLRSGKSYCAEILALRKIYELTCFDPIPSVFGLSHASQLVFMYLATSITQAFLQGLGRIRRIYDQVPYFNEFMARDKSIESMIKFRHQESIIIMGGSQITHFIGSDLFFLMMDEANFIQGALSAKYQKAVDIYRESTIRRKSTFMHEGKENGVGVVVSSSDTQTSFVEERKKAARTDPSIMVVDAVAYQVQPWKYEGLETFGVFQGDEYIDPFLVEDKDALRNFLNHYRINIRLDEFDLDNLPVDFVDMFHSVPNTFVEVFRLDIFGALKEVCGVAIGAKGGFFSNKVKFNECFPLTTESDHPFIKREVICSYLDDEQVYNYFNPGFKDFNPRFEYFGHIDQSLSNDSTGAALCHFDPDEDDPDIVFDFMIRINPPKRPAKISPEKIAKMFIWCRTRGAESIKVTADQYASAQSQQTLEINSVDSGHLSVDKDWSKYKSFVGLILTNKISGYYYPPFRDELFDLIQDNERKKIDHQSGGSKDVADAACGAACNALEAIHEIKNGFRYWPEFSHRNYIKSAQPPFEVKIVCGIHQDTESIYCVWAYKYKYENVDRVIVYREFLRSNISALQLSKVLKSAKQSHRGEMCFVSTPYSDAKGTTQASRLSMALRKEGLDIRTRKKLDYKNTEPIRVLLKNKNTPQLLVSEYETSSLVKAFRKAIYKMINGVRTNEMERSEHTYPLYALRALLEDLSQDLSVQGY